MNNPGLLHNGHHLQSSSCLCPAAGNLHRPAEIEILSGWFIGHNPFAVPNNKAIQECNLDIEASRQPMGNPRCTLFHVLPRIRAAAVDTADAFDVIGLIVMMLIGCQNLFPNTIWVVHPGKVASYFRCSSRSAAGTRKHTWFTVPS